MTVKLNKQAYEHAKKLVSAGKATHDERDDWSEHAPTSDEENAYLKKHSYDEYALWHLGVDADESEETKGRYSFPIGDFSKVHRCGVIAAESRAAQNDHDDIAKATKDLLERIDK